MFSSRVTAVLQRMHRCYCTRDDEGMQQAMDVLVALAPEADNEGKRSQLDTIAAQCTLWLARTKRDDLDFASSVKLCDIAKKQLDRKALRRSELGLVPRPDSIAWCALVITLGDLKWKAPAKFRDAVMPIPEMTERYIIAEKKIREYLTNNNASKQDWASAEERLSWTGYGVIKSVMRYEMDFDPDFLRKLLEVFRSFHGDLLADQKYAYYWDLQITKAFFSRTLTKSNLTRWSVHRRACIKRDTPADRDLTFYDRANENEGRYLLDICHGKISLDSG